MKKVKVAFLINDLLIGGGQRIMGDIINYIDKDKIETIIICLKNYEGSGKKTFKEFFENRGVRIIFIDKKNKFSLILSLIKIFKKETPDIIHALLPDSIIFGTIAARISSIKKIIVHEMNTHGFMTWKLKLASFVLRKFSRLTICYSETLEKEFFPTSHLLTEPIKEFPHKSCTIWNGVDTIAINEISKNSNREELRNQLGITPNEIMIFCAARLVLWKGHFTLLSAFLKLIEKYPNIKLVLAGDGQLKNDIENKIKAHELLKNNVLLLGARSDVFLLMNASDIFSLAIEYPKGVESISIGMSSMESMAFGLPSIASIYPDQYKGVEDKKNIILVEPGKIESLKNALEYLIVNVEKRNEIGKNGREYIEKYFSSPKIAKIYESIYLTLYKE